MYSVVSMLVCEGISLQLIYLSCCSASTQLDVMFNQCMTIGLCD